MSKITLKKKFLHEALIYIYAFVDPLFLPFGLMYAHIYAPLAIYHISKWSLRALSFILILIIIILLYTFALLSTTDGIHVSDYIVSIFILLASIIFSVYIYLYIGFRATDFDGLINRIISLKFILCIAAIILLLADHGGVLWTSSAFDADVNRLQMFFYEPSIYSLVASPFVVYAVTDLFNRRNRRSFLLIILALIPLFLSKSAGVLGCIAVAVFLCNLRSMLKLLRVKYWLLICAILLVAFFFAGSLIFGRAERILGGTDHSGIVRVVYSLSASEQLIEDRNVWLGVGPGQVKYDIGKYTSGFQAFGGDRLASSIASTLAAVGVLGLCIKLFLMLSLFFYTKSHKNRFSRSLFVFLFIYQFTGGYFNDINEYAILAFSFGYARYKQRECNAELSSTKDRLLMSGRPMVFQT